MTSKNIDNLLYAIDNEKIQLTQDYNNQLQNGGSAPYPQVEMNFLNMVERILEGWKRQERRDEGHTY